MYASVRRYSTTPNDLAAIIEIVNGSNIVEQIRAIPGCVAYYMVDGGDGSVATVSVFEDQSGAEKSNSVAAEWMKDNVLPSYSLSPPEITAGLVIS